MVKETKTLNSTTEKVDGKLSGDTQFKEMTYKTIEVKASGGLSPKD